MTFGSGGPRINPYFTGEKCCHGQPQGNVEIVSAARRFLSAVASGETLTREMLCELADVVLESEVVRLAREVREGGEHAVRRAIELAAVVLAEGAKEPTDEDKRVC